MSNFDGTKVSKNNLPLIWQKVTELVKLIAGDVDVKNDGNLQSQIKNLNGVPEELKKVDILDNTVTRTQMNFLQLAMTVQAMTENTVSYDNTVIDLFTVENTVTITSGLYDSQNTQLYA